MRYPFPPQTEQRCENCRFQVEHQCRRHAPTPAGDYILARWLTVDGDYWCGEWEPREQAS